jgi:hypothetical protein
MGLEDVSFCTVYGKILKMCRYYCPKCNAMSPCWSQKSGFVGSKLASVGIPEKLQLKGEGEIAPLLCCFRETGPLEFSYSSRLRTGMGTCPLRGDHSKYQPKKGLLSHLPPCI